MYNKYVSVYVTGINVCKRQKEETMKVHKKIMITATSAALCFAVSVPAVTFAAEGDESSGSTYISQWVNYDL